MSGAQIDPTTPSQQEHPYLEQVVKLLSFKCTPGTKDWSEYVQIFWKAFIYHDLLRAQDPLYDVIHSASENSWGLPAERACSFGPLGALWHLSSNTPYASEVIRNIFA